MNGNRDRVSSLTRRLRAVFCAIAASACFATWAWAGPLTLFVSDGVDDVIHRYNAVTGAPIAPDIPLLGVTGVAIGPGKAGKRSAPDPNRMVSLPSEREPPTLERTRNRPGR